MSMVQLLKKLIGDVRAATAIEYGLILVMIVLAMMTALTGFAGESIAMWEGVASKTAEATGN
jgi:pilus assembly protein Flp/PilA